MVMLLPNASEFTSVGVVVPDRFLIQYTDSLVAVRDGCQLALKDVLDESEVGLQVVNVDFAQWLVDGEGQRADLINYFTYEPDGHLVNNIRTVLKGRRAHVVGLFSAVPLDKGWLRREGLQSIILTPEPVDVPIHVHNIVDLGATDDYVPILMQKLSEDAMQRKIF